ncbi:GNAT family N-acetyltransferase [Amycolatopsis sp. NPDC051903]|uniref:GNAT family N-acetyltransferase n=1 Tax=Amycolatopsis sp. NPDC051903 TaxID=3363936 RepID=UPI00378DE347
MFDTSDTMRSGARSEFGQRDLPVRPALRYQLQPAGNLLCAPPSSCPRWHRVCEDGTFSWNTALRQHQLFCRACRTAGHDDHVWVMLDPAYEQLDPDDATAAGLELVVTPPGEPGEPGAIKLYLDGVAAGDVVLTLHPDDRAGVLELVRVAPAHRRRGYGRVLALAAMSREGWSTNGPRWVRGDRRGRALAAARRGEGYTWTTATLPDTKEAHAFAEALPIAKITRPGTAL